MSTLDDLLSQRRCAPLSDADERRVALVEGAHGGNEVAAVEGRQVRDGPHQLHGERVERNATRGKQGSGAGRVRCRVEAALRA